MDPRKFLEDCLKEMVEVNASDLHLKAGCIPRIRVKGDVVLSKQPLVTAEDMVQIANATLNDYQKNLLKERRGVDFAFDFKDFGRYRGNIFYQMGKLSMVVRVIKMKIPPFEDLHIPKIFEKVTLNHRGLILVSGPTSSGKSTTVAAMVQYINKNREAHVVTVEDPIEYVHKDDKCIINQREIGDDVLTFADALRYVVRQDPDIIVIGEMRDAESFHSAIAASETGHLVISTLHARNIMQCFDRILGFFPSEQHEQVLVQLSFNIKAISSQRLIPKLDNTGLVPAFEILCSTPSIDKLIRENRMEKITQAVQGGGQDGMQTFNQALLMLYKRQLISKEEAMMASDNPQQLEMNMKGIFLDEGTGGGILGND
ncbi:MAG: PilT/PilU family type 4a pilus ATPase [Candidatus Omnitrophica bacterium]|nr:PilT/PilU family type 4a pilus ATPase [Candidatus Omnitrophota bacterium]